MKLKLTALSLITVQCLFGQVIQNTKIDTTNYYNFLSNGDNDNLKGLVLTTNWLHLHDVAPIIMEEMKIRGYEYLYDYSLFKIDSNQYVVLAAYCRKSNFGFLYIQGHFGIPQKEQRYILTEKNKNKWGAEYVSCEETVDGKSNFVPILKLPENIFVLNETCYWYQYTENADDNRYLITKEIAISILRADVRKYLNKIPVSPIYSAIKEQAETMGQLLLKKDFKSFTKFIYPKIVEMMGGEQKMIESVEKGSGEMEAEGASFLNFTIGEPSQIIRTNGELQCTLPQTIKMKVPKGKIITVSTLIAISTDEGKNWYFVDTSGKDIQTLKKILPNLSGEIVIPEKQKPIFYED